MGDMHDAWFFIGVFVFIFIIWIAIGGPLHPISFTGPSLAQPSPLGGGTYIQLPRAPFTVGSPTVSLPGSSNGSSVPSSAASLPAFVGGEFGDPSPYRGLVLVSHYISGAGAAFPTNESMNISVAQNAGRPVDLTGWTLKSDASGNFSSLPQGALVPTSGAVNTQQDIVLLPGEHATIISGASPIGTSFRENKCTGYLGTFQHFSPALPQNCPLPSDELAALYGANYLQDVDCIQYVRTLPRCKIVLTPPTDPLSGANTLSGVCRSFITKYLNYNGCVAVHKNDSDFAGDTWLIYLGRFSSLWRTKNEIVKLLDASGKTVDAFSY